MMRRRPPAKLIYLGSGATASRASESRVRASRARSKSSMPRCSASHSAREAWPGSMPTNKDLCKNGGWKSFNNPSFKNQGDCVSYVNAH